MAQESQTSEVSAADQIDMLEQQLKVFKRNSIEETFRKYSTSSTRDLLRKAFELDKVKIQSSADDFEIVQNSEEPINKDVIVTGFIDLSSIEVDPNYFLTKVYDPNED